MEFMERQSGNISPAPLHPQYPFLREDRIFPPVSSPQVQLYSEKKTYIVIAALRARCEG